MFTAFKFTQNQNVQDQAENTDDEVDLDASLLEDMREYHEPGGLYQQQRERDLIFRRNLPPLESYERMN